MNAHLDAARLRGTIKLESGGPKKSTRPDREGGCRVRLANVGRRDSRSGLGEGRFTRSSECPDATASG